jgi:hypothetical protein
MSPLKEYLARPDSPLKHTYPCIEICKFCLEFCSRIMLDGAFNLQTTHISKILFLFSSVLGKIAIKKAKWRKPSHILTPPSVKYKDSIFLPFVLIHPSKFYQIASLALVRLGKFSIHILCLFNWSSYSFME